MNKIEKYFLMVICLLLFSISSGAQTRQAKSAAIINKLGVIETQKSRYEFELMPIKYQATGNDSIKIIEIEKQLSEEAITNRITAAFNEIFSDEEIDDIYAFIQTSAFDKFFNSDETYAMITAQFSDIDEAIAQITDSVKQTDEAPAKKFKPIPVDKPDGFYATVNYTHSTKDEEIELQDNPSLTTKDIQEVKKVIGNNNGNQPEISITLTKAGAQKFFLLTKENIGKPIAIVIDKHIIALPLVQAEVLGGKASISGNFSEEEINVMIKKLMEK